MNTKVAAVLKSVDALSKKQLGYEKTTQALVSQQREIFELLKKMSESAQQAGTD